MYMIMNMFSMHNASEDNIIRTVPIDDVHYLSYLILVSCKCRDVLATDSRLRRVCGQQACHEYGHTVRYKSEKGCVTDRNTLRIESPLRRGPSVVIDDGRVIRCGSRSPASPLILAIKSSTALPLLSNAHQNSQKSQQKNTVQIPAIYRTLTFNTCPVRTEHDADCPAYRSCFRPCCQPLLSCSDLPPCWTHSGHPPLQVSYSSCDRCWFSTCTSIRIIAPAALTTMLVAYGHAQDAVRD